jgi:hypothetical protein
MAKVKMTAKDYQEHGTVVSGGKRKLPIKNRQSAKNALKLMGHTKPPLSAGQEAEVRKEAAKYDVETSKKGESLGRKKKA